MYFVCREAAQRLGMQVEGARVALQGFGNVGSVAAELFVQHGAKIVAVQDHTGTIFDGDGLDVQRLTQVVAHEGGVAGYSGAQSLASEHFWDVESDFLIPAALEGQISSARAQRIRTRAVIEAANGPTHAEADLILGERGTRCA